MYTLSIFILDPTDGKCHNDSYKPERKYMMHINILKVTVRTVEKTDWDDINEERIDLKPNNYKYETVAVDKYVYGVFELGELVKYWHQRLPYTELDFQFQSTSEW